MSGVVRNSRRHILSCRGSYQKLIAVRAMQLPGSDYGSHKSTELVGPVRFITHTMHGDTTPMA